MANLTAFGIALSAAGLLAGCAGGPSPAARFRREIPAGQLEAALADTPEPLRGGFKNLLEEGERNGVLNRMRLALDALQLDLRDPSAALFDEALARIESVWADNPKAAQARSLWYEEGMKDFKGEPYERAMAYLYRGLLHLQAGEIDTARACFRSGLLQDAFAEEQQHRADFALLIYLEAWASRFMGDRDTERAAAEELARLRPDLPPLPPEANALVVVETGLSPRKVGDGVGNWQLKFRRGKKFTDAAADMSVDGGPAARAYPIEDIFLQASTRGARPIDKIIAGKVEFRRTYEGLGSALSGAGSAAMIAAPAFEKHQGRAQAVGGGLALLGAISSMVALNARPQADIRYWDNLPDAVHVLALRLPPGAHALRVRYYTRGGEEIPELARDVECPVPVGKPALVWTRSRRQITSHLPSEEIW